MLSFFWMNAIIIVDTIIIRTMDTNKITTAMLDSEVMQRWLYNSYKIMDTSVYGKTDFRKPYTHWRVEVEVSLPRYAEIYRCGSLMVYKLDIDPCGYISEIHTTHPYTDEFLHDTLLPHIRSKIQSRYPDETAKQWTF